VTAITFDTLKFANRLKAAGVPSAQAEAQAEVLSEVFETNTDALATKEDVNLLEGRVDSKFDLLRKDIQSMEGRFNAKLCDLRKDTQSMEERLNARFDNLWLKWVVTLGGIVVVVLGLFSSTLPKFFGH